MDTFRQSPAIDNSKDVGHCRMIPEVNRGHSVGSFTLQLYNTSILTFEDVSP